MRTTAVSKPYWGMKMTTEDIIIHIFCYVDDRLKGEPSIVKHPQAKLYPSELVTIGILTALKGVSFRSFYRWLKRDDAPAASIGSASNVV